MPAKNIYSDHRKIWAEHYGFIPTDSDGRSYEIHHINGDPTDNRIENLECFPIKQHYQRHYEQGDFGACFLIGSRMKIKPSTFSEVMRLHAQNRIENKTHNWLKENGGGKWQKEYQKYLVEIKEHNFSQKKYEAQRLQGLNDSVKKRKADGTYHMINDNPNVKRLEEGDHNLLGSSMNESMLANGTHPTQKIKQCPHCGKKVNSPNYNRWHGNKCKMKGKEDVD